PAARSRDRPGPLPLLPADEVLGVLEAAAAIVPDGLRIGADGSRSTGKVRARGDHLLGRDALLHPVHHRRQRLAAIPPGSPAAARAHEPGEARRYVGELAAVPWGAVAHVAEFGDALRERRGGAPRAVIPEAFPAVLAEDGEIGVVGIEEGVLREARGVRVEV